jgi:hypothetical protein
MVIVNYCLGQRIYNDYHIFLITFLFEGYQMSSLFVTILRNAYASDL